MTAPRLDAASGLVLRGLAPADRDAVHAHASSPGFFDHVEVPDRLRTSYTRADAAAFIEQAAADHRAGWPTWGIEADGRLVGTVRLRPASWRDGPEVGYGLAPEARGRGHATAAVAAVLAWCRSEGRPLPWARCARENDASARVLRRAGFRAAGEAGAWTHWRPPA